MTSPFAFCQDAFQQDQWQTRSATLSRSIALPSPSNQNGASPTRGTSSNTYESSHSQPLPTPPVAVLGRPMESRSMGTDRSGPSFANMATKSSATLRSGQLPASPWENEPSLPASTAQASRPTKNRNLLRGRPPNVHRIRLATQHRKMLVSSLLNPLLIPEHVPNRRRSTRKSLARQPFEKESLNTIKWTGLKNYRREAFRCQTASIDKTLHKSDWATRCCPQRLQRRDGWSIQSPNRSFV